MFCDLSIQGSDRGVCCLLTEYLMTNFTRKCSACMLLHTSSDDTSTAFT